MIYLKLSRLLLFVTLFTVVSPLSLLRHFIVLMVILGLMFTVLLEDNL
jgi:hypothetical protein